MQISGIKQLTLLDYPGKVSTIIFTPGCNLRCGYCHNSEFVLPEKIKKLSNDFIPEKAFFNFLSTRKGLLDGVVICGWEPTIHPDLEDFCKKIKDMGFLVKLDTNGRDPEILQKLIDKKLIDYVAMDLKCLWEDYKDLWDISKNIWGENYKKSAEILIKSALDYEFRTTIIDGVHSLVYFTKMLEQIQGAKKYYLQTYRPDSTLDPNFQWKKPSEKMLDTFKKLSEKYIEKCEIRG